MAPPGDSRNVAAVPLRGLASAARLLSSICSLRFHGAPRHAGLTDSPSQTRNLALGDALKIGQTRRATLAVEIAAHEAVDLAWRDRRAIGRARRRFTERRSS